MKSEQSGKKGWSEKVRFFPLIWPFPPLLEFNLGLLLPSNIPPSFTPDIFHPCHSPSQHSSTPPLHSSLPYFSSSTLQVCWPSRHQTKSKLLPLLFASTGSHTFFWRVGGIFLYFSPSRHPFIPPFIPRAVCSGTMLGGCQRCRQMVHLLDVHQPSLLFLHLAF